MVQIKSFKCPDEEEALNIFMEKNHVIAENVTIQEGRVYVPYDNNPASGEVQQIYRGIAGQIGKTMSDIFLAKSMISKLEIEEKTGGKKKRDEATQQLAAHDRAIINHERSLRSLLDVYKNFDTIAQNIYQHGEENHQEEEGGDEGEERTEKEG